MHGAALDIKANRPQKAILMCLYINLVEVVAEWNQISKEIGRSRRPIASRQLGMASFPFVPAGPC